MRNIMRALQNFQNYVLNYDRASKFHIETLIITSLILLILSSAGHIPGILDSTQFTNPLDADFIEDLFCDYNILESSYYAYFILDSIWAAIILLAMWKFVREYFNNNRQGWKKITFVVFTILAIGSYVFDLVENYKYFRHLTYDETIATFKIILYGLTLLGVIIVTILKYIKVFVPNLISFVSSASISLVILLIIGGFLPKAPQVNSIIVSLYENPMNLMILLLIAPLYAIVLAHYPSYFGINEKHRKWYRAERSLWLFGTIFYKYKKKYAKNADGKVESDNNFFFRILGILFYAALFYSLYF